MGKQWKAADLTGKIFGKLTVISRAPNIVVVKNGKKNTRAGWNCVCVCGKTTILDTGKLKTGNTKSCGCSKIEAMRENQKLSIPFITKYTPEISSAHRVFDAYLYQDGHCDLTYDQFYELSQRTCFYCGIEPSNTFNRFLKKKDASEESRINGYFKYNGLDRIDNTKYHTIDNVNSSCYMCNMCKSDRTVKQFWEYINELVINNLEDIRYIPIILPLNIYVLQSVKSAYRTYHKEKISLWEFYSMSQMPCFYCEQINVNKINAPLTDKKASQKAKDEGWFYYNGIDRVDNTNKIHSVYNCVPCCYYCNFGKSNNTFEDFQNWIKRIKAYNVGRNMFLPIV